MCSVNKLLVGGRCSLSEQSKSSRVEKPGSNPENTSSIPTRHGYAKGVRGCDVGRMNSRLENNRQSLRQRSHHFTRRTTPRSGATNDAHADQASSTSAAAAWPDTQPDMGGQEARVPLLIRHRIVGPSLPPGGRRRRMGSISIAPVTSTTAPQPSG